MGDDCCRNNTRFDRRLVYGEIREQKIKIKMKCSNCKRQPKSFLTDKGDIGYWFIVPKTTGNPVAMIQNTIDGKQVVSFNIATDILPKQISSLADYICIDCCEAIVKGDE